MNLEELQSKIKSTPALLVYFSGVFCSVCHELKPKVFKAINENYPKIEVLEISVDEYKEIASQFEVFALPTVVVFFDGGEFIRKSRSFGVDELLGNIQRPYGLFFD
jgi:thioredoxin-like negative regulator of GroEL